MAYDIGPKIGVEGEAQFRQQIGNINTNLKTLNTEMKMVASQFDKNDKSAESYNAKNQVLNKQIEEQKKKLEELSKGLKQSADKYGENDKVTQGWQQAVNKASAELNNMERELKSNVSEVDALGNEITDTTEKTKKFEGALGGLVGGLGKIGGAVGKAAIAGIAAVGAATVGAAIGAFKLASDAGKAADDLLTLSAQTGIATKELQEMEYAARFIDVPLETMTGSMAKLTKTMDGARDGTGGASDAFKKLGVSVTEQNGELRDSKTVWAEALDALGGVANETERDALAMQLFGKSAQDLNPLIKAGSDELARLAVEANNVGAVMSDEAITAAGKFDDEMQKLEATTQGLKTSIGVAAIPAITGLVGIVSGAVPKITEAVKTGDWTGAGTAITEGLNAILGQATALLPGLASMATIIISGIATTLVTAIPQVLPSIIDASLLLLSMLIETLATNGPMLITAGLSALMMIINGIVEALPQLIDVAIQLLMSLVNGLIENLPMLIDAAINIMLALVDGIIDLLPQIIPAAIQAIIMLAKGLIDALPKLIEKLPQIIETIVNVLIDNLPLLIDAAIQIIMALVTAIINNLPLIIESAGKIMGALTKGIWSAVGTLVGVVPDLFKSLKDAFANIDWAELGKNLLKGITSGVASYASGLAEGVVNAAKGALKAAKDWLGIKSPSRVMRDQVGKMMGAGMAEGITASAKKVDAAMKGISDVMIEDIDYPDGFGSPKSPKRTGPGGVSGGSLLVNVPLSLDGQIVTKATGKVQVRRNGAYARALGVV